MTKTRPTKNEVLKKNSLFTLISWHAQWQRPDHCNRQINVQPKQTPKIFT